MDSAPGKPFEKVKREAEDAIEMEVVSAKKQRVGDKVSEIKTDTIDDEEKVECQVKVSADDEHVVSVFEDKSNVLEVDIGAAEKKPAVTAEGHIAAALKKDESNNDSDSCFQDETSLDEDVAATIRAPAPLIEEDPAAPPKKKDESTMDSDCRSKDETILDEDVTVANLSPPAPSIPISLVSLQKNDDLRTDEFDSAHENNTDDNVATANKAPAAPTEEGPVVAWEKKDESGSDNEIFDEVAAESNPSVFTNKEDETNDELELDDETSSSDDDGQTPATPTEQAAGGKTLFVANLSFSVEQEDVENFFKAAGEVVKIRFGMNSDETFKGFGYVEFASAEAAEKALRELNGKELLRRHVRLDFAKERGTFTPYTGSQYTDSFQNGGKAQGKTVFVRGFNKADCQDEIRKSLEEHFGSCGEISRVSIPKDQDGCARGIAYIDFKDRDAFNRALALNGSEFREGTLSVKEATSRGDSHDVSGSGRGYGRNGGRYSCRDFSGSSWFDFGGGRSDWRDFSGRRGVRGAGGGRSDWRDFSGRRGVREAGGGRSDWRDFSGRRGVRDAGGGRSDWGDFSGRRGVRDAGGGRGDWRDFSGRRGFHHADGGRGDWRDFSGRRGFHHTGGGRGDWRDFSGRRGASEAGRADWRDFSGRRGVREAGGGRSGWQDFGGRRGWFGAGVWQESSQRGVRGTGAWFGGGGRGQGTPIEPCIAAPGDGDNTSLSIEDPVEDQMK